MKPVLAAAAALGLIAFAPSPVLAQAAPGEKVNQLIVYGDDPCPESKDGSITVCARKEESERFRIPAPLRDNPNAAVNQGWTDRVKAYETVGAAGAYSCSPVGSGGASGCMAKLINQAYAEKKQGTDVQMGKLIEEERARRLQTIDADAAAEQARVEQLEKQYDARIARERAAEAAAPATPAAPQPLATPPQN
ncbi:hypothetical protein [Novosphingobium huizhouense]|uniref:hypothetical protein n=1 Tax=Novosphingobium huizhouense TaxID=2866625 RepID=UPI001CD8678F|nr:hypothetical protein [Novosphingobium huizhouense]